MGLGAAGLIVDASELETASEDYDRQVSAAVASDPEVKAFVERLESAMDEVSEDGDVDPDNLPSADTIAPVSYTHLTLPTTPYV